MNLRILLTAVALLALSAPLAAQDPPRRADGEDDRPRVDAVLRALHRPAIRETIRRTPRPAPDAPMGEHPLAGTVALDRGPDGRTRVGTFVRLREPVDEALAELRAAGAEVGTVVGEIATARIPLEALGRVTRSTRFAALEAARPATFEADSSMSAIRADELRSGRSGEWIGFAGQNVLVGIYDTGIDYGHGDFRTESGKSRVLALWDQSTPTGTPPTGYGYGHYCDRESLDALSCPQRDRNAHGTHVAGTAAGDGSGGDATGDDEFRYAGVAPGAELLIVKGDDAFFALDRVVDGVAWMFDVADDLGRPIVVNLSLGTNAGPHDGTTLPEQMLDALTGPGKIIVAAIGNAGSNGNTTPEPERRYVHATATPTTGQTETFEIELPSYSAAAGRCRNVVEMEMWYDGGDRIDITIVRPDDSSATAAWGEIVIDSSQAGQIEIDNASDGVYPENGDNFAFMRISDCAGSGLPATGTWEIRADASSAPSGTPLHLWMPYSYLGGQVASGTTGFDNRYVAGLPATANDVIGAGAFVTRRCWPSTNGNTYCYARQEPRGDIARFSSAGPTRDGRVKPEVAAPGLGVLSTLSSTVSNVPQELVAPDDAHVLLQGTSMASPHVAGAVALMLQLDPDLTPRDVREILSRTAVQDRFTANTYTAADVNPAAASSDWWGYGKLDAKAIIEDFGVAPSTLFVDAAPLSPPSLTSSVGTAVPLIAMDLYADGEEAVRIVRLGFRVEGDDPAATVEIVVDADRDGEADAEEYVVGGVDVALEPDQTVEVDLEPTDFLVPAADTMHVLAVVRLSGNVPNGASFRADYVPDRIRTVGVASGESDRLPSDRGPVVASPAAQTTVLRPGQTFALSENPVRSSRLIFNFAEAPTVAAVYSIDGRRVRDLVPLLSATGLRIEWDLRNAQGGSVAPGVYLAVFEVGEELIREKLFIVRGVSPDAEE